MAPMVTAGTLHLFSIGHLPQQKYRTESNSFFFKPKVDLGSISTAAAAWASFYCSKCWQLIFLDDLKPVYINNDRSLW